jgi:putative flippase GtrA
MTDKLKTTVKQFSKFSIIGVLNTCVDLLILNTLVFFTLWTDGSGYMLAKTFSALCAIAFSYILNKNWAFRDTCSKNPIKKFSSFMLVSLSGMIVNITIATLTVTFLKGIVNNFLNNPEFLNDTVWVNLGALAGTAVGMIFNFLGYKFHVFKK